MKEKFYQKKNGRLIGECFEQIYEIISENSISKKKIKKLKNLRQRNGF